MSYSIKYRPDGRGSGRKHDLVGRRFGRLVVAESAPPSPEGTRWICRCDCGAERVVDGRKLRAGHSTSCGCARKESLVARNTTHGHVDSASYRTWQEMHRRCRDPRRPGFDRYGGRGIVVCDRWSMFANFLADMGERPPGMSIDRFPDNDGNYEPANCRWATSSQQAQNRSTAKINVVAVCLIRHMCRRGANDSDIGHAFGVTGQLVSAVAARRKWAVLSFDAGAAR